MGVIHKPSVALIDADLWTYDAAFAAQRKQEDGTVDILPFTYAQNIIDDRIELIMKRTGCTDYEFYLTGKNNFRHDIATIAPYKGNRKQDKPYHLQNLRNYLEFAYDAKVVHGMEADDMLAVRQTELGEVSVIVSRDKDLRMVEGWHYGYAVGNQPEQPLEYIDRMGYLRLTKKGKLKGGGMRWFYAQCLMGDRTDNIKGIPKFGDIKAFRTLVECKDERQLYEATIEAYQAYYNDEEKAYDSFIENARLVWMVDRLDEDDNPVMWEDVWKST